ncbi:MAG: type II CAAX endopeptidase family protein [Cyanobacteria bacterium J06597_1]
MSQPIDRVYSGNPRHLAVVVTSMIAVFLAGFLLGGEGQSFAATAMESVPFAALAIMAYVGEKQTWGKILCLLILFSTFILTILTLIGLGLGVVVGPNIETVFSDPALLEPYNQQIQETTGKLALGALMSIGLASSAFIPPIRRAIARIVPIDPRSFTHTVAFVLVTALTLLCFVPLIVLAVPAIASISSALSEQGQSLTQRSPDGLLRDELYGLLWLLPTAAIAVGYCLKRDFRQTLDRLGLHKPTWRQVGVGLGCAAGLVLAANVLSPGITWVWQQLGWPQTDEAAFLELASYFFTPLGALVIGISAGLGEELAFRGVLQPRLGLWLSNLFFTSVHAFQYNWDALILIFVVGAVCGIVRQRTNTTTCAIVHGVYNFLLIMLVVLQGS